MQIPKSFTLHGQRIDVIYDNAVSFRNDNRGEAQFRINKIALSPSTDDCPIPATQVEQTFCHELMHYLSHHAGLEMDEKEIDLLGNLLHQALATAEYA